VIPPAWRADEAERLERAFASVLSTEGAAVVGGNLSSGDGRLVANVTLLGEVDRGAAWTRAGARVGDAIAVTGHPGSAAAFLALALWGNPPSRERVPPALAARYLSPPSRVRFARALASAGGVRAAVDVSDGLTADLARMCSASGVGARLQEAALPADEPLRAAARALSAAAGQERGPLPASEADCSRIFKQVPATTTNCCWRWTPRAGTERPRWRAEKRAFYTHRLDRGRRGARTRDPVR
jgi:thiamine-monophosphate kinase